MHDESRPHRSSSAITSHGDDADVFVLSSAVGMGVSTTAVVMGVSVPAVVMGVSVPAVVMGVSVPAVVMGVSVTTVVMGVSVTTVVMGVSVTTVGMGVSGTTARYDVTMDNKTKIRIKISLHMKDEETMRSTIPSIIDAMLAFAQTVFSTSDAMPETISGAIIDAVAPANVFLAHDGAYAPIVISPHAIAKRNPSFSDSIYGSSGYCNMYRKE
jgi:hypothetical protein